MKTKGCIYYTDLRPDSFILQTCQEQLKKSWSGDIVAVSIKKPIDFGNKNIFLANRVRSYPTMVEQIILGLEALTTDYVFFTEHDILYAPTHFNFTPPRDDVYYYNVNNWRWRYPTEYAITYEWLASLSQLCCNRLLALNHFKKRLLVAKEKGLDIHRSREPRWARLWGYEPGTKKRRRGGFSDEDYEIWQSEYPNVDIRHKWTLSCPKTTLGEFKHQPKGWREINIDQIPGWNLRDLFNLKKNLL